MNAVLDELERLGTRWELPLGTGIVIWVFRKDVTAEERRRRDQLMFRVRDDVRAYESQVEVRLGTRT